MANNICSVSSMKAPKAVRRDLVNFWSILLDPWTHDFRPALTSSAAALAAFFRHQDGNVAYQVLIIIYIGNMYIYIYKLYIYYIYTYLYCIYIWGGGLNTFSEDIWKHYKSMNCADFYETLSIFEYQVKLDYTRYVPGNSMQNCHE